MMTDDRFCSVTVVTASFLISHSYWDGDIRSCLGMAWPCLKHSSQYGQIQTVLLSLRTIPLRPPIVELAIVVVIDCSAPLTRRLIASLCWSALMRCILNRSPGSMPAAFSWVRFSTAL